MKINWLVRIKNRSFWLGIIPAVIVLVQIVASLFGFNVDLGDVGNTLIELVNAVFVVLSIMGIVVDPTTKGLSDSTNALTYTEPKGE